MATSQAKSAIAKLKAAGLPRNWFSVRTERNYVGRHPDTGKACYEYGDAEIYFRVHHKEVLPYSEAMAEAGLHVEQMSTGTYTHLLVKDDYNNAGVWFCDYTVVDEYGLPEVTRIK